MNRRQLFKRIAGASAAVAVSQPALVHPSPKTPRRTTTSTSPPIVQTRLVLNGTDISAWLYEVSLRRAMEVKGVLLPPAPPMPYECMVLEGRWSRDAQTFFYALRQTPVDFDLRIGQQQKNACVGLADLFDYSGPIAHVDSIVSFRVVLVIRSFEWVTAC